MKTFLHEGICPIRDILSRLGDKWDDAFQRHSTFARGYFAADADRHPAFARSGRAGPQRGLSRSAAPCRVSFDRFRGRSDAVSEQSGGVGVEEHAGHFGTACAGGAGEVICRRYKTSVCSGLGCRAANTCLSVGEAFPTSCLRNPCGISPSGVPASRWSVPDRP